MAWILSLETATTACSVALHYNGELRALHEINNGYSHAENLTLLIEQGLEEAGIKAQDLAAVAVSKGPGSYTGLRIGGSTAKGLCFSLDIPLISINTLQSIALQVTGDNYPGSDDLPDRWMPMIDARRMEVYTAVFDGENKQLTEIEAKILDETSLTDLLENHRVAFFGDGAAKFEAVVPNRSKAVFIDDIFPSAREAGQLAFARFQAGEFEDVAYFEPFYLKDFIAIKPKKLL